MRHEVIGTDNRDQTTTVLILSNNDTVEVNPVELFMNMLDNLGSDSMETVTKQIQFMLDTIDKGIPEPAVRGLNDTERKQYERVWLELATYTDPQWDDIYEWTEEDYEDRFNVNRNVATMLMVNVRTIIFGRRD